ncbi:MULTISPECIES: hypothetical protein [unclassified Dyella]|uniref:hypothetical protein n=1 Tax=unclassified Dyella TaxID=2634549 RepID=UPI000C81C65F|nr:MULTISPECIES: hypothetical protein [unclassified Dyella]MDR3447761.1 hypothetical protein [Dyella sp.]PMQ05423.1 hypothetical protein DyAD56_08840 [Dyella sp. AD56]
MPLNGFVVTRHVQVLPILAACCLTLAACGSSGSSTDGQAAATSATTSNSATGTSYEVVLIDRPTPADGMLHVMGDMAYKLCVAAAESLHVPLKPYPHMPDDYITQRTTYISDGHSWMKKTESVYKVDLDNLAAEKGCEIKVVPDKSFDVVIEHDGKQINVSGHEDGTTSVDSSDDDLSAFNAKNPIEINDRYTDKRTVAGVNLRCLPKSSPVISSKVAIDMCVYEKDGIVTTSDKKSIVLYQNVDPLNANLIAPYTMITEVRSLKLGAAIDPSVFKTETYTK